MVTLDRHYNYVMFTCANVRTIVMSAIDELKLFILLI